MIDYSSIALFYTRSCPVECRHCVAESGPSARDKMPVERALHYIASSAEAGFKGVCLTGGEPLLHRSEISRLVECATAAGMDSTIMTSGAWATSEKHVREIVGELRSKGLGGVGLSAGPFHQEFIPLSQPLMIAQVAADLGIKVSVRTIVASGKNGDDYQLPFQSIPGLMLEKPHPVLRWGRARSLAGDIFEHRRNPPKGFCVLVALPTIDVHGVVHACCGPALGLGSDSPLILGNANEESMTGICARAEADSLLDCIAYWGPAGALEMASQITGSESIRTRDDYTSMCDLCVDLMGSPHVVTAARQALEQPLTRRRLAATGLVFLETVYPRVTSGFWRSETQP